MKHVFQVGDRVAAKIDNVEGFEKIKRGDLGIVVVVYEDGQCGVGWDEDVDGHDCGGHCEFGHGVFCFHPYDELEYLEEIIECDFNGLEALL